MEPDMRVETLRNLAREAGWIGIETDEPENWKAPLGKFEGEPVDVLYWYGAAMDGCGDPVDIGETCIGETFDIGPDDRDVLGDLIPGGSDVAILHYSDSGFVSLEYGTFGEVSAWRDRVEGEGEE